MLFTGIGAGTAIVVALMAATVRPTDGYPNVLGISPADYTVNYLFPQCRLKGPHGEVTIDVVGDAIHTEVGLGAVWTFEVKPTWMFTTYPLVGEFPPGHAAAFPDAASFLPPRWAEWPPSGMSVRSIKTSAWGWPWRCLSGNERLLWTPATGGRRGTLAQLRGYIEVGTGSGRSYDRVRRIPYRVIPLGLAANTAVYGATWYAIFRAMAWLGRRRRHRLGRCANCGYDLRGLDAGATCPECGVTSDRTRTHIARS